MKITKIIYLIPILLISVQIHSMKRANETSAQDIPAKRLQIAQNVAKLIENIIKEIHSPENNADILRQFLFQPEAREIDETRRKELYELATDFSLIFPETSSTATKKNYLYAFMLFPQPVFPQIFFSPTPYKRLSDTRLDLKNIIATLIQNEQEKIYVCCYHLSLKHIANELIQQKNKGTPIEIIVNQFEKDRTNAWIVPSELQHMGIAVLSPQNDPFEQMHHKFFIFKKNIFNKSLLVTGSYNPTSHSDTHSWDDIIIIDDQDTINKYLERFEEIRQRSK